MNLIPDDVPSVQSSILIFIEDDNFKYYTDARHRLAALLNSSYLFNKFSNSKLSETCFSRNSRVNQLFENLSDTGRA